MRFLFEFVSCCGSTVHRAPEPEVLSEEEERWLVPAAVVTAPSSQRPCRKKQRRMASAEWKPSLGSISEDNVMSPRGRESPRNGAVASAGRDVKQRSAASAGGSPKVRQSSYSNGYFGAAAIPTMMPTFSPTPFMF